MSTTMKVSLLALVSSVAAIPHYGHSKFHSLKATGAVGTGNGVPYPSGGWQGPYNSTRVPYPTGAGSSDDDKTIDVTTTSTTTVYSTVVVKPSSVSVNKVVVENASKPVDGQCGPATITVTASERVTVTVTPGGGAGAPSSSPVPVKSEGLGYGVPSKVEETATSAVYSTKVEEVRTTKAPAPSPVQPQSSKAEEYEVTSSVAQKPVESVAPSSAAASSAAASSAAASSEAPKPTPSSVNTYSGTKRGLAYNDASLCKSFGSKFGFGYNWAQVENNDIGTNFIPTMHGPSKATSQEWLANVEKAAKKGSKAVMGFNEPDIAEQANLSPEAACSAWKEYMNPIASSHPELTIIGPSVSNSGSPSQGLGWLSSFHTACPDAVVHATNIHFYDIYESATIDRFKAQVEKAAQIYGKPVWVTEFGLNPGSASTEQAATFLKDAMAYLDASDKVQGYSYFMVGSGENQLNSGSSIGQLYAGSY